jgi:Flp pilus assembly protein TadG
MMLRRSRPGTVLVEAALVYPIVTLLVFGLLILVVAVFRYQQVAHIAREASRWAAIHGARYAEDNQRPPATAEDVYANAIAPHAAGMRPEQLSYSVTWDTDKRPTRLTVVVDPATGQSKVVPVSNTVTVTVTYAWDTGLFGTIRVSSRSVSVMSY